MSFPELLTKQIDDLYVQENFKRLADWSKTEALLRARFEFLEIVITGAVTNAAFAHSLRYTPKDVILMHNLTNATVSFGYTLFSETNIYITTSGATTLRLLVGRYV